MVGEVAPVGVETEVEEEGEVEVGEEGQVVLMCFCRHLS